MPQDVKPSPYTPKKVLLKIPYRFTTKHQLLARSRACVTGFSYWTFKGASQNGTSGFQEVRCSTSRSSSSHFLHEQRPQFGTGAWHLLHIQDLIALSTGISTKQEQVPDTFSDSTQLAAIRANEPFQVLLVDSFLTA
jgi:hypothetical protein